MLKDAAFFEVLVSDSEAPLRYTFKITTADFDLDCVDPRGCSDNSDYFDRTTVGTRSGVAITASRQLDSCHSVDFTL